MSVSETRSGATFETCISARRPIRGERRIALEAAANERAVLAGERDHVCDGRQRDQVEIALGLLDARERGDELVGDAGRAEVGARVSRDDGMDDRAVRQLGAGLVVVGDDDVDAARPARPRPLSTDVMPQSAVMRRPVPRAASLSIVAAAEPVAVLHAAGDEPVAVGAELSERADEDRRGGDAVDVVVAVDRDRASPAAIAARIAADRLVRSRRTRPDRGARRRPGTRGRPRPCGGPGAPARPRPARAPRARGQSRPPRRTSTARAETASGLRPSRKGSPTQARCGRGRNRPRA